MQVLGLAVLLVLLALPGYACQSPALSDSDCGVVVWTEAEASPHAIAGNPPAEYLACEQDSDCVLEKGICDLPMAVNTKHAALFSEAAVVANQAIKCIRPADPLSSYTVSCKIGRCTRSPF